MISIHATRRTLRQALTCTLYTLFVGVSNPGLAQMPIDSFVTACVSDHKFMVGEGVEMQGCYGLHSAGATAKLETIETASQSELRIEYWLPGAFSWGDWLSIRRTFPATVDISQAKGLRFEIRAQKPSSARLRLTLSDISQDRRDELWWADLDRSLLVQDQGWVPVSIPLSAFRPCSGDGCRQNDGRSDPTSIIAYEINLLSGPGDSPRGTMLVRNLRTW